MRVVVLKNNLSHKGGLEKYALRLVKEFASLNCLVTILTSDSCSYINIDNVEVVSICKLRLFSLYNIYKFNKCCTKWLHNNYADIVFGMENTTYQTHYRAGNGVHAEYLKQRMLIGSSLKKLSLRVNPVHKMILYMQRCAFENPALRMLFTNSYMVKKEIIQNFCIEESKVQVVHNGVEWKEMQSYFDRWPLLASYIKQSLGLAPDVYQFLFVGSGFKRKGLDLLLKAISQMTSCDFQLSVVGVDKEINVYKKLVNMLGINKKVFFWGLRDDVIKFYQMADALVLPSYYDPFANVTVEALAMGLFVVTSKHNGGCEVIKKDCGVILDNLFDLEIIKAAIRCSLNHPKTKKSSKYIRDSVKHLDFSHQLETIVNKTLLT